MNIILVGKNLDDIRPVLKKYGLQESADNPELVISYGGDGAMLGADRDFPGLPKLALRDSATAPTCSRHEADKVIAAFVRGELKKSLLPKLEAVCQNRRITAINDLFIHTTDRTSSLRYQVRIDGELYAAEVRGDGACLATVHGSTAYYRSITRGTFRTGIGLAFSNSVIETDHLVLDSSSVIELTVLRGPGIVIADNAPDTLTVEDGMTVTMRQTAECAEIYGIEGFMCPQCRKLRHC